MSKPRKRQTWRVEYPNGLVETWSRLALVRAAIAEFAYGDVQVRLHRLGAGRYCATRWWSTPAGNVAGAVMVTRVTAPAAVHDDPRLSFDQAAGVRAMIDEAIGDGL
jgi:hypothetical protein